MSFQLPSCLTRQGCKPDPSAPAAMNTQAQHHQNNPSGRTNPALFSLGGRITSFFSRIHPKNRVERGGTVRNIFDNSYA